MMQMAGVEPGSPGGIGADINELFVPRPIAVDADDQLGQ